MGKRLIWYHVLRPYILWRSLPTIAVTKFGANIEGDLLDVIHSYLYFFGVWEPGITGTYIHHLRPGDVCIDIGANVGAHTLLAAQLVGLQGQVHAIEASPTIHRRLIRNLELNNCPQVRTYNVAVTDSTGPVTIYLHDAWNLGATTIMVDESKRLPSTSEAVIGGRPLSAVLPIEAIKAARLIKIDVEGAEWLVLQGMRDVFHCYVMTVSYLSRSTARRSLFMGWMSAMC
jgi:FkbM family methyltransferase